MDYMKAWDDTHTRPFGDEVWTMADGTPIRVHAMGDEHLLNTIAKLRRGAALPFPEHDRYSMSLLSLLAEAQRRGLRTNEPSLSPRRMALAIDQLAQALYEVFGAELRHSASWSEFERLLLNPEDRQRDQLVKCTRCGVESMQGDPGGVCSCGGFLDRA